MLIMKKRRFQFGLRTLLLAMAAVGLLIGLVLIPAINRMQRKRITRPFVPHRVWVGFAADDSIAVHCNDPQFDDARLRQLRGNLTGLDCLTHLKLSNTKITDASLSLVGSLSTLRYLDLENTQVSDAGLRHLAGLKNLDGLKLRNTAVTEAGVTALQIELPHTEINH